MRVVPELDAKRLLATASLLGVFALAGVLSGCGSEGSESSASSPTPPAGSSSQELAEAYKKAYGPKGVPKPTRGVTHGTIR